MEFACGFIYVSPSTQTPSGSNQIKRTALLPPRRGRNLKPQSALMPPIPPKPTKALKPPLTPPPAPPTPQQHTPVYENIEALLKEVQHPERTHRVNSPVLVWRKHLNHAQSPPLTAPKPIRKPSPSPDSEPTTDTAPKHRRPPTTPHHYRPAQTPAVAPPLPSRPAALKRCPKYVLPFPSPSSSSQFTWDHHPTHTTSASPGAGDKPMLPGNPNVLLVDVGKLVSEDEGKCVQGEPTLCSGCGSVLESYYDNMVNDCYFCRSWNHSTSPNLAPPTDCDDHLFLLPSDPRGQSEGNLLIFCICTSLSMSYNVQCGEQGDTAAYSRLHYVQEAMLQCVQILGERDPDLRICLITFNDKVTIHSLGEVPSRVLQGEHLANKEHLKQVGLSSQAPPPISQSQANLQMEIHRLQESGSSSLGSAALVSIVMASKQPGSKVLVCTDGVPDLGLGSLDTKASGSVVSSSKFYQDLGATAAAQGVSVSIVCVGGADCKLAELGQLTDGTGGKVVISSCDDLYMEFMDVVDDKTFATHCSVSLLLPTALRLRGEREAGHCGTREVGNVNERSQITFQFGETEKPHVSLSGRTVFVQVQVRYLRWDGMSMLRVQTVPMETTEDRECRQNTEDELIYSEWIKSSDFIYNNLHKYSRGHPQGRGDPQSLSDVGAALMYAMKNNYYRTLSLC